MFLPNPEGHLENVVGLEPLVLEKTLGIWLFKGGNTTQQCIVLLLKLHTWIINTTKSTYSTHLLLRGFHTILCCSLLYPLGTSTLPLTQLKELQTLLTVLLLPQLCIPRFFPQIWWHTPTILGSRSSQPETQTSYHPPTSPMGPLHSIHQNRKIDTYIFWDHPIITGHQRTFLFPQLYQIPFAPYQLTAENNLAVYLETQHPYRRPH